MRVSIRRTVRVGKRLGTPVEDLGIVPDYRHDLTQNDLLKGNVDLLKRAATILSKLPVYALTIATQAQAAQTLTLTVETKNISRLDVYVSDRPQQSLDVKDGPTTVTIPLPTPEPVIVELQGFASLPTGDQRVAVRRVSSAPN
jgi:hypothetical protein